MSKIKSNFADLGSKKLLYTKLADKVTSYITEKKLQIGDKLPSERELSTMWNVSRTSLREAIRELESLGIVSVEPGRGSYVAAEVDEKSIMIRMAKQNFFEQFEVKTVLEEYIINKIVPIISTETLEILHNLALEMVNVGKTGIFPEKLDQKFHKIMLDSYDNKEMVSIVNNMIQIFEKNNKKWFDSFVDVRTEEGEVINDTLPYHLEMVEKMKQRNTKEAVRIYRKIVELDIRVYSAVKE